MRKFTLFSACVLILSYSMYGIATASDEQIFSEENEEYGTHERILEAGESVSFNEIASDYYNIEGTVSNDGIVVTDENLDNVAEELVSGNERIDFSDEDKINEIVNISSDNLIDVSSNEIVSENGVEDVLSENKVDSLSENGLETIPSKTDIITKVKLPTSTHVYLNPENLLGKGEIFSDDYRVSNCSNHDILIKIKNIRSSQKTGRDIYRLSEDTPNDIYAEKVKVNLDMVWKSKYTEKTLEVTERDADEAVIYLEAAQYNNEGEFLKVKDGSEGIFYFTGTLDGNLNVPWENSGAMLNFEYEIVDDENEISDFLQNALYRDNVNLDEEISE